eukprot:c3172_g1_i1.p1 GENE.c3172_g1_i1~~c3172_g1_i1.p1  ORF type:complete len:105 (-),score=34.25 c3172_g1_i1:39-353(-)
MYFIIHIQNKPQNDFTGPESYVWNRMQEGSLDWFPKNKAIRLLEQLQQEEEVQNQMKKAVDTTHERAQELAEMVVKLSNWSTKVSVSLEELEKRMDSSRGKDSV